MEVSVLFREGQLLPEVITYLFPDRLSLEAEWVQIARSCKP
jgi:hypothetical protein